MLEPQVFHVQRIDWRWQEELVKLLLKWTLGLKILRSRWFETLLHFFQHSLSCNLMMMMMMLWVHSGRLPLLLVVEQGQLPPLVDLHLPLPISSVFHHNRTYLYPPILPTKGISKTELRLNFARYIITNDMNGYLFVPPTRL